MVSLDIEGAFDNAWWPTILRQLTLLKVPCDVLLIARSYFSVRQITLQYAGESQN